jgi:alpha-1,6-mannosyltransferase
MRAQRCISQSAARFPQRSAYNNALKICDLTQFYSPVSGGVKRYIHEKIAFVQKHRPEDEHVLIVPGARTELIKAERSRIYSVRSPLLSRQTGYRVLLNLRAIGEVVERERPHLIETSDPYQLGWKAVAAGGLFGVPVVGFYHSHFSQAYLQPAAAVFGSVASELVTNLARAYVRRLYNQFAATLVPSGALVEVLHSWRVRNLHIVSLGVNTNIFRVCPDDADATRYSLGINPGKQLLLYVGRLAPEKNTQVLVEAFNLLRLRRGGRYHLLIVGDGLQRGDVEKLRAGGDVTWLPYCADSNQLARLYRAADIFVHPGLQETFGLVALESQACGVPVVGIRGSNMDRVILHDQAGWANENSGVALADAIDTTIAFPDLAAIGQEAAAKVHQQYSWQHVFEQLFCIYEHVRSNYRLDSRT